MEPSWMTTARMAIGQKETPGQVTSPFVSGMLSKLHAWWTDDETAWCSTFASWCLQQNGFDYPKAFYRARAFLSWGRPYCPPPWTYRKDVAYPCYDSSSTSGRNNGMLPPYGTICVIERGANKAEGHVGFVVDIQHGHVFLLAGNQDNQVCVRPYPLERALGFRWPAGKPVNGWAPDTVLRASLIANLPPSRSEA